MIKDYTNIEGTIGSVFAAIVDDYHKTKMLDSMSLSDIKEYVKNRVMKEATKSGKVPVRRVEVTIDRIYTKPQVIMYIYNSYLCDCGMSSTGTQVSKRRNEYRIF